MRAMPKPRTLLLLAVVASVALAGVGRVYWKSLRAGRAAAEMASRAQQELSQQRIEAAFLHFQTLAELHPEDPAAWLGLARVYFAASMPWAGETAATRAIETAAAPGAEALLLRAQLRERLHRRYSAALDANAALKANPANAEARALLARLDALAPLPPAAPQAHEKFWPGKLADAVRRLPQLLQHQDWDGAGKLAADAERDYPATMIGPWLAGIGLYARGRFPEAEVQLRRALAFAPRSSRVATNLAGAWAKQKGPLYAAEQLLKLQESDPGFVVPLDIAATAYLEARQPAGAENALRRGVAVEGAAPQAFLQLANYFRSLDRPAEALRACVDGLAHAPLSLELLLCRADLQASLGQDALAVAGYEEILKARPDAMPARVALARLYIKREDEASRARAFALVSDLKNDAPGDANALDAVGWVLARQGDLREARNWLAVAAQMSPEEPSIRYHYGFVLAQLHEREAAKRELQAALALGRFSESPEAQKLLRDL